MIANWAAAHHMPIFMKKTVVLHWGLNQLGDVYTCNGKVSEFVNSHKDFCFVVFTDSTFSKQSESAVSKAAHAAYAIRRVFQTRH